ncbi:hypothetical protein [Pilimelia columellifera]|uniref:Uncharacterized protein n=1 Tax=Pilimelia columellifera subsp. columellifera TaxID=706583 RepID=A0ABN3NG64_9ACTN
MRTSASRAAETSPDEVPTAVSAEASDTPDTPGADPPAENSDSPAGPPRNGSAATGAGPWGGMDGAEKWWRGDDEDAGLPPAPQARRAADPARPPRTAVALAALVPLALLAAFFSWVAATPLLLAAGHGEVGTATVTSCVGDGVGRRCVGRFESPGFVVEKVGLLGAADGDAGRVVQARILDRDEPHAYVGEGAGLHLRWIIALLLALGCGAAAAWATGAGRLPDPDARRNLLLGCLAGPVVLTIGFIGYAW